MVMQPSSQTECRDPSRPAPQRKLFPIFQAYAANQECCDYATLVQEAFTQVSVLFYAIRQASGRAASSNGTEIGELCKLGRYLCDDMANTLDSQRERMQQQFGHFERSLFAQGAAPGFDQSIRPKPRKPKKRTTSAGS